MRLVIIGILCLLAASCSTSRQSRKQVNVKARSTAYLVKQIAEQTPVYNTMASNIKFDGVFEGKQMKFRGKLIHVNDSLIWMNMTKLGLEVGRVMITRDSFYMLNRLLREYIAEPLSYLEEEYNVVPDFDIIENALVGLPAFPKHIQPRVSIEGFRHLLQGNSGVENVELTVWLDGMTHAIDEAVFEDQAGRKIMIDYALDEPRRKRRIPARSFNTENVERDDYSVSCIFENMEYDEEQKPRFKIPKRYDRVR